MLSGLPVDVVALSCQFLSFRDVEELAWTTKQMMQVVKDHLPTALEPKIDIKGMKVHSFEDGKDTYSFGIEWKNPEKTDKSRGSIRNESIRCIIREGPPTQEDEKVYKVFLDYYRYRCIERNFDGKRSLNFDRFAVEKAGLVKKKEPVPAVNLHMFLGRADVGKLDIDLFMSPKWHLLDIFATLRANFDEKKIRTGSRLDNTFLGMEYEQHFANKAFFQNNVVEIHCQMTSGLLKSVLRMPHFANTRWELSGFEQEHFNVLINSRARSIKVNNGTIHLISFLSDLMRVAPFKPRTWTIWFTKFEEDKLNWNAIKGVLDTAPNVKYSEVQCRGWDKRYKIRTGTTTWNLDLRYTEATTLAFVDEPESLVDGTFIDIRIT
ncbi:hypothetical protein WR25_00729 [Diploscapter pachys]|uniref:F-box domain-containing protein n=1 Tax=Diploscapter pachys TaxID=2018661 RepID=A0A2A2LEJ8_9BILA|nr:hypothetical protein WR25_00729 [Diploscapter pachys]